MKQLLAIFLLISLAYTSSGQAAYDEQLAKSLGADDYGMKSYVLAILKSGSYAPDEKTIRDSLFRGHMNNIDRLVREGKMIIAGPLGKNDKNYRGLFIFDVKDTEEAKKLVATDPAVKAGVFDIELYPWYGSAALPVYIETHKKIEKKQP